MDKRTERLVSQLHCWAEGSRVSSWVSPTTSAPLETSNMWRMFVCSSAKPKRSLLSPCAQFCADERFALFVILFPLSGGFLLGFEKTLLLIRMWQSYCDGCHLTLILKNTNEGVQNHSFLLSVCWFPKCKLQQHMPITLASFTLQHLYFQPLSPHQSFPIHWLPSSSPILSVCAGNDLCCCKNISHFHFHD